MINWDLLTEKQVLPAVKKFASGEISGRQITSIAKNTIYAGETRKLVRNGVTKARTLARKALKRRELA